MNCSVLLKKEIAVLPEDDGPATRISRAPEAMNLSAICWILRSCSASPRADSASTCVAF